MIRGQRKVKLTEPVILPGKMNDLEGIIELYDTLIDALVEAGTNYPCWKKHIYPNKETAFDGIIAETIFIAKDGERIIGTIILNNCQPEAYSKLQWDVSADDSEVLVIHTLAVHPDYLKSGIALELLKFADEYAYNRGCKAIRLDVTVNNVPAIKLYEKCGFTFIGDVDLELNSPGLELFKCYEKLTFK